jgi:penicillin-binding protein 1A
VMTPAALATMTDLMQAVVTQGSGRAASLGDRPVGGKTGTTNDYRDAWFVGFTSDYVGGAWFGNDDGDEMERTTGGSLPARLWKAVMLEAHKGIPVKALPGAVVPEAPGWFARLIGSFPTNAPAPATPASPAKPSAVYDFANDPLPKANQN